MSTQRNAWALAVLVTVCGTTQAEDARVIAKLDQLGAFVRRDESKPGQPIVSVEVLGILERKMTDADLKELATLCPMLPRTLESCQIKLKRRWARAD